LEYLFVFITLIEDEELNKQKKYQFQQNIIGISGQANA
jgi:hypothetical protein